MGTDDSCFAHATRSPFIILFSVLGLCITTLLTVATIWGGANSSLPRVNYVKAVDVYLMTSFCFVLCTLIEYVLVLNCENVRVNCRKRKHTDDRNGVSDHL